MSLVTLTDLKVYLGIDELNTDYDVYLNSEITLFDDLVDDFEYLLYHFPIQSITSVTKKLPGQDDITRNFRQTILHQLTGEYNP